MTKLFVVFLLGITALCCDAKNIHVTLQTKWTQTSLLAEAAEYFAVRSNADFWDFLNTSAVLVAEAGADVPPTQYALYTHALQAAAPLLHRGGEEKVLELSLATRLFSPRVQMQLSLRPQGNEFPASAAAFVVLPSGKIVTDPQDAELTKLSADVAPIASPLPTYDEDHVFPSFKPQPLKNDTAAAVTLFGQMGTLLTTKFHNILATLARKNPGLKYVFRHHFSPDLVAKSNEWSSKVQLQGYGATLHLKNTEYKAVNDDQKAAGAADSNETEVEDLTQTVAGIDFAVLRRRKPNLVEKLTKLEEELRATAKLEDKQSAEVDLNVWDVQNLGMQACVKIIRSADPLQEMRELAQNFPRRIGALSKTNIKGKNAKRVINAIAMSQQQRIPYEEGASYLSINGRSQNFDEVTIFGIAESIQAEVNLRSTLERLLSSMKKSDAEVTSETVKTVLDAANMEHVSPAQPPRIHFDTSTVYWLNNLEKDPMYKRWSTLPAELILTHQPRMVKKNLINTVSILDPSSRESLLAINEHLRAFNQMFPIRFGIILVDGSALQSGSGSEGTNKIPDAPVVTDQSLLESFVQIDAEGATTTVTSAKKQASATSDAIPATRPHAELSIASKVIAAYQHIVDTNQEFPSMGYQFLSTLLSLTQTNEVKESDLVAALKEFTSVTLDYVTAKPEWRKNQNKVLASLKGMGLMTFPLTLINGRVVQRGALHQGFYQERYELRPLVIDDLLSADTADSLEVILKYFKAEKRYQPLIYESEKFSIMHTPQQLQFLENAVWLSNTEGKDKKSYYSTSHILRGDVTTVAGIDAILEAAIHIAEDKASSARLAVVLQSPREAYVTRLFAAALSLYNVKTLINVGLALRSVASLTNDKLVEKTAQGLFASNADLAAALKNKAVVDAVLDTCALFEDSEETASNPSTGPILYTNGRRIELAMIPGLPFISKDYSQLESHEATERGDRVVSHLLVANVVEQKRLSDVIVAVTSALGRDTAARGERRNILPPVTEDDLHGFVMKRKEGTYPESSSVLNFNVVVIVDPLSAQASKIVEVISLLNNAFGIQVSVYLNPRATALVPTKAFTLYVSQPTLAWHANGTLEGPVAFFSRMPSETLLTLGVEEPEAWLVFASQADHDLDNVRLNTVSGTTLYATYELQSILLTGSCVDQVTRSPPRGLPLVASMQNQPNIKKDTLVMSNYGYFQLQAAPGVWNLQVQEGRASDIYGIVDIQLVDMKSFYWHSSQLKSIAHVVVNSFTGNHVSLKVAKKAGKENENLLVDTPEAADKAKPTPSMWSSLFGSNSDETAKQEALKNVTVNIFSVASGHLYERFLRLMMYTVTQTTKAKVKFWLIENFLSPRFKKLVPHLAKKFNCEYAFVTYKWPHWLKRQTEKQRTIWGYKVLFLDVLFPLDVDRIIFVDADQIVRSDIAELYTMDLKSHAVAYTPFCIENINEETKGYRFWASGYWKDHLRGKPYHISAIYVVDLKQFRRDAAGDTYRATYDNLSQDPNSLANLDQDLPNYLQHAVPIYSLPEEWLWCETWCTQKSKERAKTIDLCNNPKTKAPKLDNAKRIIPEWTEWDSMLTDFENSVDLS